MPGGSGIAKTNRPSTPLGTRTVGGPAVDADHVQPVDGVGQDVGQVGAEQDAQVLAQVIWSFHRDPEGVTHRGTMPVRSDQVAAADGRDLATDPVAEPGRHAIRIPLERDQLGRKPDLAHAERPVVVDEDRFEVVLRAHGGGRRAHRRGHLGIREAEGTLDGFGVAQPSDRRLARHDAPAAATHLIVDAEGAEDLHRAGADAGRPREDRGRRMALDDKRAHALPGEADGRHETSRAGADDEDRHLEPGRGSGSGVDLVHVSSPFGRTSCPMSDIVSDEVRWRHGQTSIRAARAGRCIRCDPSPDPRGGPRDPRARTPWRPQGRRGGAGCRRLSFDRVPPVRVAGRAVRRAGAPSPRHGRVRRAGGLEPIAGRPASDPDLVPDRRPHVRPDAAPRRERCSRSPRSTPTRSPRSGRSRMAGGRDRPTSLEGWRPRATCARTSRSRRRPTS